MQGRGHWTYDCYYLKHKIQDLINQDLRSLYVSLISHLERGDVKLLQDHLHIIRDNDTIDIESYGKLTLSSIASDIHKIVGWRHQLNVTVRPTTKLHNQVVYQVQNFILLPDGSKDSALLMSLLSSLVEASQFPFVLQEFYIFLCRDMVPEKEKDGNLATSTKLLKSCSLKNQSQS
ncbi:hypothetical protein ACB094_11G141300 [Castanea mollissima]